MYKQINSVITFKNGQGISARGTLLTSSQKTIVFEVYNPCIIVKLSEVLDELSLAVGSDLVYRGKAVVSNLVNTGLMLVVSATLVDSWADLTDKNYTAAELELKTGGFIDDWDSSRKLEVGYLVVVGELRSFLGELSRWVERLDIENAAKDVTDINVQLECEFFQALVGPVLARLDVLFAKFEAEAQKVNEEDLTIHKIFAQADLHPLMLRSPFFYRSYTKPLGYAGDYEMVNMMTRKEGREGPTTYSQIINAYYYNIGPTVAHRNRIDILFGYLSRLTDEAKAQGRQLRVLNVGCGPALEIQKFIREYETPEDCIFKLMDFNSETIDYTSGKLNKISDDLGKSINVEFIQKSVHTLLQISHKSTNEENIDDYDFVYCAGLFDYLSDRVCSRLLKLFNKWVCDRGIVLSTNVCPSNPSRWSMEHNVDWYLIHRDEEGMLGIAPKEGSHRVYLDETGFNVFLESISSSE